MMLKYLNIFQILNLKLSIDLYLFKNWKLNNENIENIIYNMFLPYILYFNMFYKINLKNENFEFIDEKKILIFMNKIIENRLKLLN